MSSSVRRAVRSATEAIARQDGGAAKDGLLLIGPACLLLVAGWRRERRLEVCRLLRRRARTRASECPACRVEMWGRRAWAVAACFELLPVTFYRCGHGDRCVGIAHVSFHPRLPLWACSPSALRPRSCARSIQALILLCLPLLPQNKVPPKPGRPGGEG